MQIHTLVGSSGGTTVPTSGRSPPIATTIPSRQKPQIHMMPTPGAPRSCAQQANEHPNTASHSVQSDPAIVTPNRARSCGKKQTTSTGTQDTQGPRTSTAIGHFITSDPKLRYDGAKCWHPPKPGLKRISQVFKENYKSWQSFDEADDDTRKIWWTEWRNQSLGRPSRMDEFFEHTHTHKEDRTQWVDEHSRMAKAEQERQAAIEAGVTDPPPVSEESIWIETVGGKRKGRVYSIGEVRNSSMVRPRVDGPTTTTITDILDLRE
ncbi:uncharacterized protein LOC107639193 isoform X2 [Arachis ipaensis]|uniref:uncharacterized protein LOC107639193 isoform X2 n=1 Tax=Arachis ipaensis TaxID=130454 RepID=UPI0007AF49A1|nr:uncharacterized protein LOC107639193 isoform X2 [Arachis ipaensis]